MVDPTTANTSMAVPIRGSNVGTWDTPVNSNFNILDNMFGGVATVALTSAAVTLASSQAQASVLRFTGTLTANVAVTLAGIYKSWTIDNQTTNAPSSYYVTIVSTSAASVIGVPQGQQDIFYDGTTVKFRNMDRIGAYWDYAGSAVPNWVAACTNIPYLNCDGTAISSATFPQLVNLLGTTTLPDSRGRFRATLNSTTTRLQSSVGGLDGSTIYGGGGYDSITLNTSQIPSHTHANVLNTPPNAGIGTNTNGNVATGGSVIFGIQTNGIAQASGDSITNVAAGGGGPHPNVPPAYIGGITMIRTGL